jgi:hypothetical protein
MSDPKFIQVYFAGLGLFGFTSHHNPKKVLTAYKQQLASDLAYLRIYKNNLANPHLSYQKEDHQRNVNYMLTNTSIAFCSMWLGKESATDEELLEFFTKKSEEFCNNIRKEFEKHALPVMFVITNDQQKDFKYFLKQINGEKRVVYRSTKALNSNYLKDRTEPYMQVIMLDYTKKETV